MHSDGGVAATDSSVHDRLVALFTACNWRIETSTDHTTIGLVFTGPGPDRGSWHTFVRAFETDHRIAVYGVLPFTIEPTRRLAAAELIARINFGIVIGNFELDFNDGEVRYRTSLDFEGTRLSEAQVLHLVRANANMMAGYLPAFVALGSGNVTPLEALSLVE